MHLVILSAAIAAVTGSAALAHVTLETTQAQVNGFYKAVLRVPHGCEGSPTTALRVKIPDGVISVKPMPKPGWTVETVRGKYAKSYKFFHGAQFTEGVVEIAWSGGKLADEYYDEFVFQAFLSAELGANRTIYFPVVQQCEKGVHRWIEVPEAGKSAHDLPEPAPGVKLLPAR
jgi:uncharacterized protein YcnI